MSEDCPLCKMEKLGEWKVIVLRCQTHPDKWMIVLGRHTAEPTQEEMTFLRHIASLVAPNSKWRGPGSIKEHYHLHEV